MKTKFLKGKKEIYKHRDKLMLEAVDIAKKEMKETLIRSYDY